MNNQTYQVKCKCKNCGSSFTSSIPFGMLRPATVTCQICGNEADTYTLPEDKFRL